MRLDKYLKNSRLIKRRPIAKSACDAGRILVNGKVAKAGSNVDVGDEITINLGENPTTVKVLKLKEHVRKDDAEKMYDYV